MHILHCQNYTLEWRHNGRNGVSNQKPHDCLLNRLFSRRSKKTPTLRVTGLCAENSPVTGEFPAQRTSNTENVSIWWRHRETFDYSLSSMKEYACYVTRANVKCYPCFELTKYNTHLTILWVFVKNRTPRSHLIMTDDDLALSEARPSAGMIRTHFVCKHSCTKPPDHHSFYSYSFVSNFCKSLFVLHKSCQDFQISDVRGKRPSKLVFTKRHCVFHLC